MSATPVLPWVAGCVAPRDTGATPSSALVTTLLPDALLMMGLRCGEPRPLSTRPVAAVIDVTRLSIIAPTCRVFMQRHPTPESVVFDVYAVRASCLLTRGDRAPGLSLIGENGVLALDERFQVHRA